MTYREMPGLLMDVASFLVYYFNEEFVLNHSSQYDEEPEHVFEYYYQMKSYVEDLPDQLHPFAYADEKTVAILAQVVSEQPFQSVTLDTLTEYLESDAFKFRVYCHWFSGCNIQSDDDIHKLDLLRRISEMRVSEQMKFRLILFFNHFELYREKLIRVVLYLSEFAINLRERHKSLLRTSQEKYDNVFCYKHIKEKHDVDVSDYDYAIELINSQNLLVRPAGKAVFFGVKTYSQIKENREITLNSFAFAYNDSVRVQIIDFIFDRQSASMKDITDHLKMKHSSIYHHVNILLDEGILVISKHINKKFYYSVNTEYFEKVSKLFSLKADEFTKPEKGSYRIVN